MKDYSDFPPLKYFIRVLKNCPQSSFLYVQLWKKKGKKNNFITEKKDIRREYLISPTMFRNLLAPLTLLNLVTFIENEGKIQVDVLGPHSND